MKKIKCLMAGLIAGVLLVTSAGPVGAAAESEDITFLAEETSADSVGSSTKKKYTKNQLIELARKYYKKYKSSNVPPAAYAEELLNGRVLISLFENHSTHTATLARYNVNYYGVGYDDIFLTKVDLSKMDTSTKKTSASIKLNASKITLAVGQSKTLKAVVKGKSKSVTWKSSDSKIASVSKSGKVTAKKVGKATITAKANGKTAKCVVTVTKSSKIEVSKYLLNIKTLKTKLKMTRSSTNWQRITGSSVYEKNGFYLMYSDTAFTGGTTFSIKNEGNPNVVLYGYKVGGSVSKLVKKLKSAGWCVDGDSGKIKFLIGTYRRAGKDPGCMLMEVQYNGDKIKSWYICNWPQGDFEETYQKAKKHPVI